MGAAFVNQTPLDWKGNLERVSAALDLARERSVSLLCLPELALCGYGCEDLFFAPFFRERCLEQLKALLPRTLGLCTAFGLPFAVDEALHNVMAVCADGRLLGLVPKQCLALDGLHYEPRWFKPWPAGKVVRRMVLGQETTVGDLCFGLGPAVLGFEICEDAWGGDARPAPRLAARGANLVFSPAASHFAFGKQRTRLELGVQAARGQGLAYVYANLMGNESGRVLFDGGAYVLDAQGRLLAQGERFSFRDFGLMTADVEIRASSPLPGPGLVQDEFFPPESAAPAEPGLGAAPSLADSAVVSENPPARFPDYSDDPYEEFSRAVSLALCDYLRKSHARGFCLSLSGGADSAACAVLVRLMAELGSAQLGWSGFARRLPDVPGLENAGSVDAAMPLLLRTLYQAGTHSSALTRDAAAAVAKALGARHRAVDIQPLVDAYRTLAEGALGRKLDWEHDDLTLQNLQARVRSPGVWALANAEGRLLLATNNRSEAATGYTTMDGDTSGGLAPVAGVGKDFLRGWLRWMEAKGPSESGPLPALSVVNAQAPTAELRPPEAGQTDEGDLMPYAVLDYLERAAVARHQAPRQALEGLRTAFPVEPLDRLKTWTRTFYRLWSLSQWKRERLAVSIHVDDHNVDPRSWCRWPVLNAGFQDDVKDLA
ncbi:MAG: NAD(+) synthase [bacterium]